MARRLALAFASLFLAAGASLAVAGSAQADPIQVGDCGSGSVIADVTLSGDVNIALNVCELDIP